MRAYTYAEIEAFLAPGVELPEIARRALITAKAEYDAHTLTRERLGNSVAEFGRELTAAETFPGSPLASIPTFPSPHPESICQDCRGRNIVWFADNSTWNRVMGDDGGLLCPVCFVKRAEAKGIDAAWRIALEDTAIQSGAVKDSIAMLTGIAAELRGDDMQLSECPMIADTIDSVCVSLFGLQ